MLKKKIKTNKTPKKKYIYRHNKKSKKINKISTI